MEPLRHEEYMRRLAAGPQPDPITEVIETADRITAKLDELEHDPVNNPSHYTHGDVECIDAIQAALGPEGFRAFCRGNIIKYLWRTDHKHKDTQQDLEKARWYLNRIIRGAK